MKGPDNKVETILLFSLRSDWVVAIESWTLALGGRTQVFNIQLAEYSVGWNFWYFSLFLTTKEPQSAVAKVTFMIYKLRQNCQASWTGQEVSNLPRVCRVSPVSPPIINYKMFLFFHFHHAMVLSPTPTSLISSILQHPTDCALALLPAQLSVVCCKN